MFVLAFAESIQLFPDGTLFIHIALILLMIWVLNRTLFRPINQVIEAREKQKGGHGGEAAEILNEVGKKEAKYAGEMLDARTKGYELIEKENKKATAARDKKIAEAKAAAAAVFEAGRDELEKQAADARAAIGSDAERIADSIAASILKA
jgi:F-type H+-transporting ATPase subunit b